MDTISPFQSFKEENKPDWHGKLTTVPNIDRQEEFSKANFNTLIKAITGLFWL